MPAHLTLEAPETERVSIEERLSAIESQLQRIPNPDSLNLLVFSGERDRLLAAFVMATGAAACGQEVTMFFTFWATAALRKTEIVPTKKTLVERAFGWMLPRGLRHTRLSQMDFGGLGRAMMSREMRQKNIADLDQLIATAADLGVRIRVCEMSMKLMGIQSCELIDYPALEFCGIASFADSCSQSNTTFMI